MSDATAIPWCDSTWNPWWGCTKVSPGCLNCYAETWAARIGEKTGQTVNWGKEEPRRRSSNAVWQSPLYWNDRPYVCDKCGRSYPEPLSDQRPCVKPSTLEDPHGCLGTTSHNRRIFTLSMGDMFDPEVDMEWKVEAWDTISKCGRLTWLIVTKRPELFRDEISGAIDWNEENRPNMEGSRELTLWLHNWIGGHEPPKNVWMLTSVEDQLRADLRVPALLQIPAVIRGLSVEPILEDINFSKCCSQFIAQDGRSSIHWVIVGGESGNKARKCDINWVRNVRNQCLAAYVPVFIKQLGSNPWMDPKELEEWRKSPHYRALTDRKGERMHQWPLDLRIRQWPG